MSIGTKRYMGNVLNGPMHPLVHDGRQVANATVPVFYEWVLVYCIAVNNKFLLAISKGTGSGL